MADRVYLVKQLTTWFVFQYIKKKHYPRVFHSGHALNYTSPSALMQILENIFISALKFGISAQESTGAGSANCSHVDDMTGLNKLHTGTLFVFILKSINVANVQVKTEL